MSIILSGQWTVSIKSKSALFDQRVVISGTTNGKDGVYPYASFGTKTLKGGFGIQIQYEKGGEWHNSLMRLGNVSRSATNIKVDIKSDDNVGSGDLDFNDLILEAAKTVGDNEWCIWGQIKQYSGCFFNPCLFPKLVIDDWLHVAHRLPKDFAARVEPILPELPPLLDPPPYPPWDYRALRLEIPPILAQELVYASGPGSRRGAFRTPGIKSLSNPGAETYKAAESASAGIGDIMSASIIGKLRRRCHVEPIPGAVIRVIDYDPGTGESTGQLFAGTGDKEILGHVITDDYGYYIFCFSWPYPDTGLLKPDILLQFMQVDEEGIPSVTLESRISWNIDKLYRKDFCIPSHLVNETPTDDIVTPARIFQYVGNLPVVRITQSGSEHGHGTSQTGDLVTVIKAPFGGVLYLKGSFHDYATVKSYRITYWTTDNPDGNISETTLLTPLKYYDANFDLITVGPGPVVFPGVPADAYPIMRDNYAYSHPFGRQYKAYINTRALKTGLMRTGNLYIKIQGLNSGGSNVTGAVDEFVVRVDNVAPVPEIEPITAGSGAGAGCGFIEINDPNGTFPLTYRVSDAEGHLFKYYFRLWKCHNNQIGGNHYSQVYDAGFPLHFYGTIDDPASTWDGWKTVNMPNGGELFTAAEIAAGVDFVAVSIELWAISRSTDGRHNHLHWPRYVEVVGVKYVPTP
jgi:hypothetical protein